jgi:hypothetical protein
MNISAKPFVVCAVLWGVFHASMPSRAEAQSGWELGYQLAHIPRETLPLGVSVGVLGGLTPTWSVIGEIAAARESEEIPGLETKFTILDVGGGMRWTPQLESRVRPFVQVLVGAVRRSIDFDPELGGLDQSETDFMIQPGAGIAYRMTDLWSAVAALKLTETLTQNEFDIGDEYRLFFGVRLDF